MLKERKTVSAGLDLNTLVPQGHVELRVQLVRAERALVLLELHESTVVAISAHIHTLLLDIELVGNDLKHFGKVKDAIGSRLGDLFLSFLRHADGGTLVNLAVFDLCDGFGKDSADLSGVKEIGV